MSKSTTPKKVLTKVTRGKKPNAESVNDLCRLCKCPLKLKYGHIEKVSYVSSDNLFKLSQRKDCDRSKTLAQMVEVMGMEVTSSPKLSDRVCKHVGEKFATQVNFLRSFVEKSMRCL